MACVKTLPISFDGTDHHNGYFYIGTNQIVKVAQYKQMSVFGILENEGQLQIEGMLILEE